LAVAHAEAVAIDPARTRPGWPAALAKRLLLTAAVLGVLWGLWELYRWIWITTGWTHPFVVDDLTMPHMHDIVHRLFLPTASEQPALIRDLLDKAAFTMREALAGFVMGAVFGFAIGVALHASRLLRRGFLPFVVASQTIPILAIAPMVVIWGGSAGLPVWLRVGLISAFLTFFPVTINTIRGLDSAQPRALELMRSYAAGPWRTLWKVKFPASLPYVFAALKVSATASVVGAIIGELPSSIQDGLGGAILNFNQYYVLDPPALWATNIVAAGLGIAFFGAVVLAERLVVRSAPEHVA
jgi:NitT/TauT family transport system permease protein